MRLSESEIIEIINKPRYTRVVSVARENQIAHDRHVSGKHFKKLIVPLKGFEHEDQERIKEQVAIPATVPIISEVKTLLSKWLNATDTHKDYSFSDNDKDNEKKFKSEILSNVYKGSSMDYFVKYYLNDAVWNKFNDFLIVTRSNITTKEFNGKEIQFEQRDGIERVYEENTELNPFIATISIHDVYDFLIFGNRVEYLVYKHAEFKDEEGRDVLIYMVLDDNAFYTVRKIKENEDKENYITILSQVKNELTELPCVRVSSLQSLICERSATSLIEPALQDCNRYVNVDAINQVSYIKHAFPFQYAAGAKCQYQDIERNSSVCENGRMTIRTESTGAEENIVCPKCKGTGWNTIQDASQTFIVPFYLESDQKPYSNTPIGYAETDVNILKFQYETHKEKKEEIKGLILSKNILVENSISKTATEVIENVEPITMLNMLISNIAKITETKLTDWIGQLTFKRTYIKSLINYGTNYANKRSNEITKDIEVGKKAGISLSELSAMHEKRIKAINNNNPDAQLTQKILFELEPFNTLTVIEVEKSTSISSDDKIFKIYFPEYIKELKENNDINIDVFLDSKNYDSEIKKIRDLLMNLHQENLTKIKELKNAEIQQQQKVNNNNNFNKK